MMRWFRDFMRFVALAVGIVAGLIALVVDFGVGIGTKVTGGQSHILIGLLIIAVGVVGAIIAPISGRYAALLMFVSAIAFFFIAQGWGAISGVFFIIAAALAFFDRSQTKVQAA